MNKGRTVKEEENPAGDRQLVPHRPPNGSRKEKVTGNAKDVTISTTLFGKDTAIAAKKCVDDPALGLE